MSINFNQNFKEISIIFQRQFQKKFNKNLIKYLLVH